ncbi:MAG: hypothetical protein KDJ65_23655 [Anaerolineae bacterium]|nr:hypothetical protein [Anaerolineae bacterium]
MSTLSRIAVIYNSSKPRKHLDKFLTLVQKRAPSIHIDVVPTTDLQSGLAGAVTAYAQGYDLMIAAGGDGTLMSVVNAVVPNNAVAGILPLGTGNDYAKAVGINSIEDAAQAVIQGAVKQVDVGLCTYHDLNGREQQIYFCSTAGVGFFANVSQLERQRIGYCLKLILKEAVWPLLGAVSIFLGNNVTTHIQLGSKSMHTKIFLCEISKVTRAGGFLLTPQARVDSGFFDCWMVQQASKAAIWSIFFKAVANRAAHLQHPNVTYFSEQPHIKLVPETPQPIYINGEVVGETPVTFQIIPKSLQFLTLK